jgi:hypothetical protein
MKSTFLALALVIFFILCTYCNSPIAKACKVNLHGVTELTLCTINGKPINIFNSKNNMDPEKKGAFFDNVKHTVTIYTESLDVNKDIEIQVK